MIQSCDSQVPHELLPCALLCSLLRASKSTAMSACGPPRPHTARQHSAGEQAAGARVLAVVVVLLAVMLLLAEGVRVSRARSPPAKARAARAVAIRGLRHLSGWSDLLLPVLRLMLPVLEPDSMRHDHLVRPPPPVLALHCAMNGHGAALGADPATAVGGRRRLDNFQHVSDLGAGNFGVAKLMLDRTSNQLVAVKVRARESETTRRRGARSAPCFWDGPTRASPSSVLPEGRDRRGAGPARGRKQHVKQALRLVLREEGVSVRPS